MPFLSRRSADPLTPTSTFSRDKVFPWKQSDLPQPPRNRARSEASIFRRVSTLFSYRKRNPSKSSLSLTVNAVSPAVEYISHTLPRSSLARVSGDTTPQASLEIRRPSGLGRRASLCESGDSITDSSEEFAKEIHEARVTSPAGYVSLPNLLGIGPFPLPPRPYSRLEFIPPLRHTAPSLPLPNPIFRVVLEFLPRGDLALVALVSHGFCSAARYALYHSLDVQTMPESSLAKLYNVLACKKILAALVVNFSSHYWPSWELTSGSADGDVSFAPSDDVQRAFQNMYNLKSLSLASFASILSHTASFTFSLTSLTILDKQITQPQFQTLLSWLATQPLLESLSFPHFVEYTSSEPLFVSEWPMAVDVSQANSISSFIPLFPCLKTLHASTEIVSALCLAINHPIEHLTLDVHETLYTGLRPSSVIGSLNGVRQMHIIFSPEVDKRTVEKFLGITGTMLTGEDCTQAMLKSLEVEVTWTHEDAAETLYGIVTSIISRFRGLEALKLTTPFRSIQAPIPESAVKRLSLFGSPKGTLFPSLPIGMAHSSVAPTAPFVMHSPCCTTALKKFAACDIEKTYARTWTKYCPTLSDVHFDFSSCSTADAEVDVELCGVWFRRKMSSSLPSTAATA